MKKKRKILLDALIALLFCWAISYFSLKPDREAILLLTGILCFVATFLLLPFALHNLLPFHPFLGGFTLIVMLSPLILAFSHPAVFLLSFSPYLPEIITQHIHPWLLNGIINTLLIFCTGFLFVLTGRTQWVKWSKAFFVTLLLASLYGTGIYYYFQGLVF